MAPDDVQRLRETKKQVEQTIERNERAIREARTREVRYRETLRRSDAAVAGARRNLRRAGYLK
jgi:predicted  nucleic acid-binding Zn-ribbon protein